MECGKHSQQKLLHKIKRVLISLMKGGDSMDRAMEILVETMSAVQNGKMPIKAADVIHKNGHTLAHNRYSKVRLIEVVGDSEHAEMLAKAQENLLRG